MKLRNYLAQPILSSLMTSRSAGLTIAGAAAVHFGLYMLGLPGWVCPIRAVTGVPCPGCGLTRAMDALARGDVRTMLNLNAFAPVFVLVLALIAAVSVLPEKVRIAMLHGIGVVEQRTGAVAIGLLLLVAYWLARLFWFGFPPGL